MTIFIEGYPPFVYSFTGYCLKKKVFKIFNTIRNETENNYIAALYWPHAIFD